MNLASKKRWHTDRAISRAIENVVVVVVVTIREGSFGSGMRFDWENFKDPKLLMASSERKECSTRVNRTRCGASGKLTTSVANKSLKSLVNGLSSSVMRNKREDVWCILL
jgi:hypothetical protein